MTATVTSKSLFNVTIRRTYTPAHRARWSDLPEYTDSTHPEWGDSAEQVVATWAEIHGNQMPYWLEKFRDEVLLVEPLNADERREQARRYDERCCDLAVIKPCVCSVSFTCPDHGTRCHGTHD